MYDVRLLTLFKQHYRDAYDEPVSFDYSCWGYYDGLNISDNACSTSVHQNAPIPAMWHIAKQNVTILQGDFSVQNIGLIRCLTESCTAESTYDFWSENFQMPFFAVALLQISNRQDYRRIGTLAEQAGTTLKAQGGHAPYCRTIAYCTFDNADLVLLLHSNSLLQLAQALHDIEALPDVCYVHSIAGVSEGYLNSCIRSQAILSCFGDMPCCLDEILPEIHINAVTDGAPATKKALWKQLEEWCRGEVSYSLEHTSIYRKNGHETFMIILRNVLVSDILRLSLPGGIVTHQNPLYGHSVYNIATSLLFHSVASDNVSTMQLQGRAYISDSTTFQCKKLINTFKGKLQAAMDEQDESLCSYYQAMLQTLNTMSQYEQFRLSEDIFLVLIPSFNMFNTQFSAALHNHSANRNQIKNSLCMFLEYANSVIYHTIHTDQVFLMVPGYSGASFSIPIKLTLLFSWLTWKLSCILNDSDHTYQCILTPVMESRPITHLLDFATADHDRLIAIKVSQRLLYLPRQLTIILSHEIAHYIGKTMRNRSARLLHLANLVTYYIGERLFPSEEQELLSPEYAAVYETCRREVELSLGYRLREAIHTFQNREPYADECIRILIKVCRVWLVEQTDLECSVVLNISVDMERDLRRSKETYTTQMRFFAREKEVALHKLQALLCTGDCDEVIDELFSISQEVFADMVALALLNCTEHDFEEAFLASEGSEITPSTRPAQQWFRQNIASRVVFNTADFDPCIYNISENPLGQSKAREEIYQYAGVGTQIERYARICYSLIRQRLDHPDVRPMVTAVREFYQLFTESASSGNCDIYSQIINYICEYESFVKDSLS